MASSAAVIAAVAQKKKLQQEEEEMTRYTPEELSHDWEFKIVRSNTPMFHKPETLNKLIEEEARAGWVMLEVFDNSRVRFKRPRSARAQDANLPQGFNPYRTIYGLSEAKIVLIIFGSILLAAGLLVALIFLFK